MHILRNVIEKGNRDILEDVLELPVNNASERKGIQARKSFGQPVFCCVWNRWTIKKTLTGRLRCEVPFLIATANATLFLELE